MNAHVSKAFWWLFSALVAGDLGHAQAPVATNSLSASLERNGKREVTPVHDPSTIVKCKNEYWFFATGLGVNSWRSKDLKRWAPRNNEAEE